MLARLGAASLMTAGLIAGGVAAPASAHSRSSIDYVALGDSYSSGLGGGVPLTTCGQTAFGYPTLLDKKRSIDLEADASCSGAITSEVADQAASMDRGTDLVTITIGGNDLNYGDVVGACLLGTSAQCDGAISLAVEKIDTVLPRDLDAAYDAIREESKYAHVVVLGYPLLFSPQFGRLGEDTAAAVQLNEATKLLNSVIADVARANRFQYVDVTREFRNHGIGAPRPWIWSLETEVGVPLHPTAEGYKKGYLKALKSDLNINKLEKRYSGKK